MSDIVTHEHSRCTCTPFLVARPGVSDGGVAIAVFTRIGSIFKPGCPVHTAPIADEDEFAFETFLPQPSCLPA